MRSYNSKQTFFIILLLLLFTSQLLAQGYYFGRNKVQYNEFDWQILKTEHFDIYFYPEMKDVAEKGAKFAEDSYKFLQTKFNHTINRRIPLIFYSSHLHFQQTNITPGFIPEGVGGFFEFLKGRVVIPSNGNINQFKKVIRHELVHVFMHSKVSRVLKNRGKIDGTFPPLWYTEGLAELWSSEWDSQGEMVIKDAVINNYMVPLDNMYYINGTFMMYKAGQNVLEYISENYGEDKVLSLMENIWKHNRFEDCFEETLGKNYQEFDQEWMYALKKEYYPHLADHDFSRNITSTIVRDGYNFKPAYYEKDGKEYVVFVANRTGYSSIYRRTLKPLGLEEEENAQILVKGEKSSDFEAFHLFSSKIDISKNGILTFGSKSGESDALYLYDLESEKITGKYYFKDISGVLSPAWSPDGKKIAFSGLNFSGYKDIYIFDPETENLAKITNDFYDDNDPSWSPDGKSVVFSSDRTEYGEQWSYNIFLYDLESAQIKYITYGKSRDSAPVFSPDGKYIAYTSDRDLSLNIYLASLDSSKSTETIYKLTHFTNAAFDPEWTPDGGLLFGVFENRSFQIRSIADFSEFFEQADIIPKAPLSKSSSPWKFENIDSRYEKERVKYKKDYDLDIAQTQVTQDPIFGTAGGAQLAFTDVLGNDQYHVLIYNNAQTSDEFLKSFNFSLTKVDLGKRTNYAYGIFRFAGRYFNYQDAFFYEERTGAFVTMSYPLSQFMRISFSTNYSYSDKEWFFDRRRIAWLSSNFASFVKDNSIWSPSGPIEGQRINLTIGNTYDIKYSNVNYFTLMLDYRQYFRLGLRSAYAVRFLSLNNEGREARQYYIGGSWDMRGYPRWSIRGKRIFFTSHELRFPFIDLLGIRFPFGSVGFNSIRGALFLDAGNAWNEKYDGLIGSFGAGVRMRFIGFLVLRLDFARRTDFSTISNDWYTQFFFGWDF